MRRLLEGLREPWSTACTGDVALAAPTDAAMQLKPMFDHGREAVARVNGGDAPEHLMDLALIVGTELRAVMEKVHPQTLAPSPLMVSGGAEAPPPLVRASR